MVLHVSCELERRESRGNPGLRENSMKHCSSEGLLGVAPKSHNVPHPLGMERLMSSYAWTTSNWYEAF